MQNQTMIRLLMRALKDYAVGSQIRIDPAKLKSIMILHRIPLCSKRDMPTGPMAL